MAQDANQTQLPPSDLQAERYTIGSVLIDCRCLDQIITEVAVDDFYLSAHQHIWRAILTLGRTGSDGIDATTLTAELNRTGHLEEIGGERYLLQCFGETMHSGHAVHYARIVAAKSRLRQLDYAALDIRASVYRSHADDGQILQEGADRILKLLESQHGSSAQSQRDVALRSIDRLESPIEPGIDLGFRELDQLLYGAKPGQLILLGARPGVGKSAWVGSVANYVAQKHPTFFASIEMTADELFDRGLCARLGISLSELRPFARDNYSRAAVDDARQALSTLPIMIDDSTDQTVQSIAAQSRIMQRKQGLGLIIVDYLQLVTPANKRDPREQQVGQIAWGLKCMAKNLGVPVIALAQLNRDIEKRVDRTPKLSDIRESGAIEQHSSVILFLDRPSMWDSDKYAEDEAVLLVAKHRGGRTGKIDLKWVPRSATFVDPDLARADGLDLPDVDFGP